MDIDVMYPYNVVIDFKPRWAGGVVRICLALTLILILILCIDRYLSGFKISVPPMFAEIDATPDLASDKLLSV